MSNHEQAAFGGAAGLPTPEQVAAKPWKYPQGRITPEEDDDMTPLSRSEARMIGVVWGLSFAAMLSGAIALLGWVFQ